MVDKFISKEQLRIGMFVHLDLPWMQHPFLTSSFKIRTQAQLDTLRGLRLEQVRLDPERSDVLPGDAAPPPQQESQPDPEQSLWEEKRRRIEVLRERRSRLNQSTHRYDKSVHSVRTLMSHLFALPAQALEEADGVVCAMVDELTADQEVTAQLVSMKSQDESAYYHVVNVAVLSLLLGRGLGLDRAQLRLLGSAALFHDLGHQKVPSQILRKKGPRTGPEQQLYQRHPIFGEQIASRIGNVPLDVIQVIAQHHEFLDGTGYPRGLRGNAITALSRIVTVVNRYDNLCNGVDGGEALSPYEAVSRMYSRERARYDRKVLTRFISGMGVYPPGTVVRLSDGRTAAVVSINPGDLLRPNVLVYDPRIPKEEALILDLGEEELTIAESCRRQELEEAVLEYLNLSDTIGYSLGSNAPSGSSRRR